MTIVGRPIWRLTEGKHIAKLEITWQLTRQPIQRRTKQRKNNNLPAAGVTEDGVTSKMAESKMAASTLDCKMLEALNVAMCSTPTGSTRSPPGHSTPIAEETTTYHSLEGEWNKVVSKKKNKKTGRKSTPRASKDKPVVQQRTPSPPRADPVPITGPKQGSGGGGEGDVGQARSTHLTRSMTSTKSWPTNERIGAATISSSKPTDNNDQKKLSTFSIYFIDDVHMVLRIRTHFKVLLQWVLG